MPYGKENKCNRKSFEMAVAMLKFLAPENEYKIENIYLDYGAGMMWETIVVYRKKFGIVESYQMLSPRAWDQLAITDNVFDISQIVTKMVKEQAHLLGLV